MVIDQPRLSNCSKIAAGIWNPVVFKRLTKSWMADEILPGMLNFYKMHQRRSSTQFITERNIVKIFSEEQEKTLWYKKSEGELCNYLDKTIYTGHSYQHLQMNPLGFSKVLPSGNLDVNAFLTYTTDVLKQQNSYLEETFDSAALSISGVVTYKDTSADNIIFAEGHLIKNNSYFSYIPMKPAKGEVICIKSKDLNTGTDIINKNGFLFQIVPGEYKVGATYNWEDQTDQTSETGLQQLESKLKKMIDISYTVIQHQAGVRPSVIDRRPILGAHPLHKNVFVFNGLGTKGVMLAPYFAEQMTLFLQKKINLIPEVDVARFNKFFVN